MSPTHHIAHIVIGAALALFGYSVRIVAQAVDQVPAWVREFGAPTVMLVGALLALTYVWKELKSERDARIADRDSFIETMRADADKGEQSRKAMLEATLAQTNELKALRHAIQSDRSRE